MTLVYQHEVRLSAMNNVTSKKVTIYKITPSEMKELV